MLIFILFPLVLLMLAAGGARCLPAPESFPQVQRRPTR